MGKITHSSHTSLYERQNNYAKIGQHIDLASTGIGFQTHVVLQQIVRGEKQRIKEEQMLWRVGGSLLGMCFGLTDGFQLTDLFVGMSGAAIGNLAHEKMSKEDQKFLEDCQSLWLIGCSSPIEIQQRLGPARSRIVMEDPNTGEPMIFNHHQGNRGNYLVQLGTAGNLAVGFKNQQSLEVMSRHMSAADISNIRSQLYPVGDSYFEIEYPEVIQHEELLFSRIHLKTKSLKPKVVLIRNSYGSSIAYQVTIPAHSDF